MELKLETVPRRKLYEDVVDQLIALIQEQRLPVGSTLPSERDLIKQLGIGRPALREALLSLEQMGFIKLSNGQRARVASPNAETVVNQVQRTVQHILSLSDQSVEELQDARLFFEAGMARIAASSAVPEDIEQIELAFQEMRLNATDPARFQRADLAFHLAIAKASRNGVYAAISRATLEWLFAHFRGLVALTGAENLTLAEHAEILACIKARDPEGAVAAMTRHITRTNKGYRTFEAQAKVT